MRLRWHKLLGCNDYWHDCNGGVLPLLETAHELFINGENLNREPDWTSRQAIGGLTIISDDFQSFQILDSQTQKMRSAFLIFGLLMLRC